MPDYVPIQDLTIVGSVGDNDLIPLSDGSGAYAVKGSTLKSYVSADAETAAASAVEAAQDAEDAATAAGNAQTAAEEAAATAASTAATVGGKIEDLTETNENAYVAVYPTLTWEQGGIANNGGGTTASDRIRTPEGAYFTPANCVNPYLTITVATGFEVKIQEYSGTPASSATATGRYSAYKSGTWNYAINPAYNYRLCARKASGGSISPSDVSNTDVVVHWLVATDRTLSVSYKAADAKKTGDALEALQKSAFGGYKKTSFNDNPYSIVAGYYSINTGAAAASSSGIYARTEYLYWGVGERIAILLDDARYQYRVGFYDNTGATDGTGYIGYKTASDGVVLIPDDAIKIGLTFYRADGAAMTSTDYDNIQAALFSYRPTDTELESSGVPADAKSAGDLIAALSVTNVDSLNLLWDQGGISSSSGNNNSPADTNILRTFGYVALDSLRGFVCFVPDGWQLGVRRYNRNTSMTYLGYDDSKAGLVWIDNGQNSGCIAYRFVLRKIDRSDITPVDISSGLKIVPIYRNPWEVNASGKSKPTVISQRCNPTLVADFLAVAETYYTHRNDKTGNDYDMTYGYNSCIQTTEYTREIDCSTFVQLVMRGWSYEQTQYYTHESGTTYPANPDKVWSVYPPDYRNILNLVVEATGEANTTQSYVRTASQIAEWMIDQGRRIPLDPRMVNVEPGDIVFWANVNAYGTPDDPNRFGCIGHIGICCSKRATTENDPWPASLYPYAHEIIEVRGGNPCCKKRYLEVGWDDAETGTITHSGVDYVALVCRPDLGALS